MDNAIGNSAMGKKMVDKVQVKIIDDGNQIPKNFSKEKAIVIILNDSKSFLGYKSIVKNLKKFFEDDYNGRYEFVDYDDYKNNSLYSDKNKYRYVFGVSLAGSTTIIGNTDNTQSTFKNEYVCTMYDEVEKKQYQTISFEGYGILSMAYIRKLEEVRKK
jgi:hypothetical protein